MASILLDQSRVLGSQIEASVATHFTGAVVEFSKGDKLGVCS
jgi:hypothetical protein